MKLKNLLASLLAIVAIVSSSTLVYGQSNNDEMKNEENLIAYSEAHYREMDNKAGIIIEKYDNQINGKNDIDYCALATSLSENTNDRVAAMRMIIKIYDVVSDDERQYLKSYIESYAPYTENDELIEFNNKISYESVSNSNFFEHSIYSSKAASGYNRTNAVKYATDNYNKYNSNYPDMRDMGGDCANFVSQCLFRGGKAMSGNWYVYKKNNVYPKPNSAKQLNYSWNLSDPSPWISAKEFNSYWKNKCNKKYEYKAQYYIDNHKTIYSQSILSGDVVQFKKKVGFWYQAYHTMIIVGYDTSNKDFILAGHSSPTKTRKLLAACNDNKSNKIEIFHIT